MMSRTIVRNILILSFLGIYFYLAITPKKAPQAPKQPKSIGLCIMATGKYVHFANNLIDSAERFFLPGHKHTYFVFTDRIEDLQKNPSIVPVFQKRLGWPYDSMMRTAVYFNHKDLFNGMDYLFACDADMLFVDYVCDEILHERVGTLHPGFINRRGTYDTNTLSKACVSGDEGAHYFAGGFYGGTRENFIALLDTLTQNVQDDLNRNIIALWHDESHLNRYFIDHEPTCILDTSYCYAEGRSLPTPPRLVALHKSKAYWRS
jgi:histo-blood group ABO system transferase